MADMNVRELEKFTKLISDSISLKIIFVLTKFHLQQNDLCLLKSNNRLLIVWSSYQSDFSVIPIFIENR